MQILVEDATRDEYPYVVPMHYAFDGQDIYFFTTEGTKTEFIAANGSVAKIILERRGSSAALTQAAICKERSDEHGLPW